MAGESSFDVVSKVDRQEVDNALNQAAKEVGQRYDFRGTAAGIAWSGERIMMRANSEDRVKAVLDVFQTKLVKRGVSLKALDTGDPRPSGKEYRIEAGLKEGLSQENAKKIAGDQHPEISFILGSTYAVMEPPKKEKAARLLKSFQKKACRSTKAKQFKEQCETSQSLIQQLGARVN